jgi:hypothetical protein
MNEKLGAAFYITDCTQTKIQTKYYYYDKKHIFVHRGTEEYHDKIGQVAIINSTLGKAMGGASGGYTAGPKELIDLLRQKARPYLFSNSLPPSVVATGIKVSTAVNPLLLKAKYMDTKPIFTIIHCTIRICL